MDAPDSQPEPPMTSATAPWLAAEAAPVPGGATRDAELLERYAGGDRAAFDELVNAHQEAAYTAAWRILGDGETAHDVVQEAFLRILRHHERFDASKSFRTWLLSIVRNLAIDSLRRRRRLVRPEHLADASAPAASSPLEAAELRERVAMVLDDLPEKYRSIIVMREMEGMPAENIARDIGVDYSTTRWRLHQARQLFRQAWVARFGKES